MESSILSEVDDTSSLRTGLSTPLSLSSQPATASRLLPPRSGLERSDFVLWHIRDIARSQIDFRFRWKSGRAADITAMTEFDSGFNRAMQSMPARSLAEMVAAA